MLVWLRSSQPVSSACSAAAVFADFGALSRAKAAAPGGTRALAGLDLLFGLKGWHLDRCKLADQCVYTVITDHRTASGENTVLPYAMTSSELKTDS